MATLYVRDVPERLYKHLRTRARRNGRSLNAEVLEILEGVASADTHNASVTARLRELAAAMPLSPGAPTPEEIVRDLRGAPPRGL